MASLLFGIDLRESRVATAASQSAADNQTYLQSCPHASTKERLKSMKCKSASAHKAYLETNVGARKAQIDQGSNSFKRSCQTVVKMFLSCSS